MKDDVLKSDMIYKYNGHSLDEINDLIAIEYPLTIVIDGKEFTTLVCSPDHLEELTIAFLASEGFIRSLSDIDSLQMDEGRGFAYVELKNKQLINKDFYSKRFIGSCCGKSRQFYLHNDVKTAKTITSNMRVTIQQCTNLMKEMQHNSLDYHLTGGLHNAVLCTKEEVVVIRSDIGRHNALDKIYGYCLQNRVDVRNKFIVFSGRISSEVLLKVSKIGVAILVSKSAPTTLAIELAKDLGITMVGFVRGQSLNIYSHPNRVIISK